MSILFQFLFFCVASIFASLLITNNFHIPFGNEDDLTNRNEQTQILNKIDSPCFQGRF